MADEITYSGLTDLRIGEALSAEFLLLLADRDSSLTQHPALVYAGSCSGSGSATVRLPHVGLAGYDLLASTSDGAAVANSAFSDGKTDILVGRYAKSYEKSDLASLTGANGMIDAASFAADAAASYSATLASIIANLCDDFTAQVTDTGAAMTVTHFLSAIETLEVAKVDATAGYMCVLHPVQYADLRANIAASTAGAVQWVESSHGVLENRYLGSGYRGQFLGVDVFVNSNVPVANGGADRAGAMGGRGFIAWADGQVESSDPTALSIGGKVLFEIDRTPKSGLTAYVSSCYLGGSLGINAAGVTIITDAG